LPASAQLVLLLVPVEASVADGVVGRRCRVQFVAVAVAARVRGVRGDGARLEPLDVCPPSVTTPGCC
jgi:hypothetical protein